MKSPLKNSLIALLASASIATGARAQTVSTEAKDSISIVPQAVASEPAREPAPNAPITLDASIRFTDKYTPGRGYVLSDEPSVQPYLMLNVPVPKIGGTFSVGYAGSISVGKQDYQEHDRLMSYARDIAITRWGTLTGTVGHMTFTDNTMPGETRFSELQAQLKLQHALNPTVFFAHDYGAGNGQYIEGSLTRTMEFPIGEISFPFDASMAVLYNNHYVIPGKGFAGMRLGANVPLLSKDGITIAADFKYFQTWQPERFKSNGSAGITLSTSGPVLR
ncbi:TPA: hypothetical protein HA251_06485 [Candidatus Woesearchaeota archaeon]|nr:hypothetical protein [Candidatus Woesearchaeota archaeon]